MKTTLHSIVSHARAALRGFIAFSLLSLVHASATTLTYTTDIASTAVPDDVIVKPLATDTVVNSVVAQTSGTSFTFTGTLDSGKLPIKAGSVVFKIGTTTFTDDGCGYVGTPNPNHVECGTVNYATGAYSLTCPGTLVSGTQTVAATGTTQTYTGILVPPVKPGSVNFQADELTAVDNGYGGFTIAGSTGTINYATGAYSVTFYYPTPAGKPVTYNYRNAPPATNTNITASYVYASAPGRQIANNITNNTIEASWFGVIPNDTNVNTRLYLQRAIGGAERWSASHPNTTLLLPAGIIQFGDGNNPVNIRSGNFALVGCSGTQPTIISAVNSPLKKSIVIWGSASNVEMRNLKFDLKASHDDYACAVVNKGPYFTASNCEFYDSTAMNYGSCSGTASNVISNWVNTSGTYSAQITVSSCQDLTWATSAYKTYAYIYDSTNKTLKTFAKLLAYSADGTALLSTDTTPINLAQGDLVYFVEHFTRQAILNGASHFYVTNCFFNSTQLLCSDGVSAYEEDILADSNQFADSQAYGISYICQRRSNGWDQVRKNATFSNNTFYGFQRAAFYVGLDWGNAIQNSCVYEGVYFINNTIHVNRHTPPGGELFTINCPRTCKDFVLENNLIIFDDWSGGVIDGFVFNDKESSQPMENVIIRNNVITYDDSLAANPPKFVKLLLGAKTKDLTITGNTFDVPGEIMLWRDTENVLIEDNTFNRVTRLIRDENQGRFSIVGNSINCAAGYTSELLFLHASNWAGGDFTIANNAIQLAADSGTNNLVKIVQDNGGYFKNIEFLNNNIITGNSGRVIYSGTFPIKYALDGQVNWTFDEGFGTVAADGANANDLTLCGGATWTPGAMGTALYCNGSTAYATTPSNSSTDFTSNFSISAWVKAESSSNRTIISKTKNASWRQYKLALYNGQLNFMQEYNGTSSGLSSGTISLNTWHHVAATVSPSQLITLYIDGKQVGSMQGTVVPAAIADPVCVGRDAGNTPNYYFKGAIDEVQIHSGELSASDVQKLAFGRNLGYWRMEEGIGTTTADESGLGNTGTLIGGVTWTTDQAGGKAVQFNGYSSYVNVGSPSTLNTLNAFSACAWINSATTGTSATTILSKNLNATKMVDVTIQGNQVSFTYGTTVLTGTGIEPNTWQYVAVTVDNFGSARIYIDGAEVARGTVATTLDTTGLALKIGCRGGSSNTNFFNGKIGSVELYDRALWITEIRALAGQ